MSETIIREDYNVQMDIGKTYIRFQDLEDLEQDRVTYYVARKKVEKLCAGAGISMDEAALLLGKIQQVLIECLKFNKPDRERKCRHERKVKKIPEEILIGTLCNLLEVMTFEELFGKVSDMKYYQIEDLCNSPDPITFLEGM